MQKNHRTPQPVLLAMLAAAMLLLMACAEQDPLRLGYVGGVSGRTADLGIGGRNGVQLAVEQANAGGGINGRRIELLLKDDEAHADKGKQAVKALIEARVEAIIGPMTSNVAVAVAPLATEAGVLMVSPSVTTNDLNDKDDQFFRVVAPSAYHAVGMADFLLKKRQVEQLNVVLEMGNKAYTESWFASFEKAYLAAGGRIAKVVRYTSAADLDFTQPAAAALQGEPEAIVMITSAVDAALLANQFRQQPLNVQLVTAEWAGTGKLTELGGANVEGVFVPHYFNHNSRLPAYVAFRDAYQRRFNKEPGFPAVVGFNAAQVVIRALQQRHGQETLKQALLRIRSFEGLQETLAFNEFGDVQNRTFFTVIKEGRYVAVD